MINVWSGCTDGFEEYGDKLKVVVNKVKSWRCLDQAQVSIGKH